MTLYGVGLGPGEGDLVTVRGKGVLEDADAVYSPGRLSRTVALNHVDESKIGGLDFPMTKDEAELRRAWKAAAAEIAPNAVDGDVAFVTLGDPNIYSTFGHLRRTIDAFHPDVELEIVPGVSAVTAFATALGVEIEAGAGLSLREAANGRSPTGPDRMILFKVTDATTTHEGLVEAGYDVTYGRRLFMEQGETVVTDDPEAIDERDYYTLAYAERADLEIEQATAAFGRAGDDSDGTATSDGSVGGGEPITDGGVSQNATDGAGPQAAIDAQGDRRREELDDRIFERSAGDDQAGIPFVGAGPGDPRLLTVAGKELLAEAQLVVHAGSLVNSELLDEYCDRAKLVNSVGKDLEELVPLMRDAYEDGENVVRLHSGDPAIYGAALEQMDALEHEGVPTYFVPGVTSAFAASATLRTQLTLNEVSNHVAFTRPQGRTLTAEDDHISEFVDMGDVTTCVYLGTHAVRETMDRLLDDGHDPETPVAVVYHASWPDEDVIVGSIGDIADQVEKAGYRASALVVIGDAVTGAGYERSYLYGDWANRGGDSDAADEAETDDAETDDAETDDAETDDAETRPETDTQ
mgnify:CR=1 FL=1